MSLATVGTSVPLAIRDPATGEPREKRAKVEDLDNQICELQAEIQEAMLAKLGAERSLVQMQGTVSSELPAGQASTADFKRQAKEFQQKIGTKQKQMLSIRAKIASLRRGSPIDGGAAAGSSSVPASAASRQRRGVKRKQAPSTAVEPSKIAGSHPAPTSQKDEATAEDLLLRLSKPVPSEPIE